MPEDSYAYSSFATDLILQEEAVGLAMLEYGAGSGIYLITLTGFSDPLKRAERFCQILDEYTDISRRLDPRIASAQLVMPLNYFRVLRVIAGNAADERLFAACSNAELGAAVYFIPTIPELHGPPLYHRDPALLDEVQTYLSELRLGILSRSRTHVLEKISRSYDLIVTERYVTLEVSPRTAASQYAEIINLKAYQDIKEDNTPQSPEEHSSA